MLTRHPPLTPPPGRVVLATSRYAAYQLIQASDLTPVAISRGLPRFPLGYQLAGHLLECAPTPEILHLPFSEFDLAYRCQLAEVDLAELERRFRRIAGDVGARGCVALCFEDLRKHGAWCHRTIFATVWREWAGADVLELGTGTV